MTPISAVAERLLTPGLYDDFIAAMPANIVDARNSASLPRIRMTEVNRLAKSSFFTS